MKIRVSLKYFVNDFKLICQNSLKFVKSLKQDLDQNDLANLPE